MSIVVCRLVAVLEGSVVGASELLTLLVVIWFWLCVLAVVYKDTTVA